MAEISISILSANFCELGSMTAMLEEHRAHYLHLDVMDGNFVPNISFGPPLIRSLEGTTALPFDIHLMVTEPGRYIEDYVTENTDYIVVHEEACKHLDSTLSLIRSFGVKCGVALNPSTNPEQIAYVLDKVDQVLVMSVNPGFGGQRFIPSSLAKVSYLADRKKRLGYDFKIAIDGGIDEHNICEIKDAGADIIVVGTAILKSEDPGKMLDKLNEMVC